MTKQDEYIKALDYTVNSPFVRKIKGVVPQRGDSENDIQRKRQKLDQEVAHEIKDISYMLFDVKKEHEKARDVIIAAGEDKDEQFSKAAVKYLDENYNSAIREADAAQKELDALPRVDEKFIAKCREQEKAITQEYGNKKEKIQNDYWESHRHAQNINRLMIIVSSILLAVAFIMMYEATVHYSSYYYNTASFFLGILAAFFFGMAGIWGFGMRLIKGRSEYNRFKQGISPKRLGYELYEADAEKNKKLSALHKQMEQGYENGSDVHKNIIIALNNVIAAKENVLQKGEQILPFMDEFQKPAQKIPALLQKTIDNMYSLNNWAAYYIQNEKLAHHYDEMASIERDKLQSQKEAQRVQAEELRRRNELLRQQTIAAKAQAEAAERQAKETTELLRKQTAAAQAQAEAAERQAKDTEAIKKRMENERYGDDYKIK